MGQTIRPAVQSRLLKNWLCFSVSSRRYSRGRQFKGSFNVIRLHQVSAYERLKHKKDQLGYVNPKYDPLARPLRLLENCIYPRQLVGKVWILGSHPR